MSPKNSILTGKEVTNAIKTQGDNIRLCLLFGEESFLIDQVVSGLKKMFLAEGSETMDYVKIDFGGKNINVSQIRENVEIPPWFSRKRLVIVKNSGLFSCKDADKDKVIEAIKNIPDSTLLVFVEPKIDKKKKKFLEVFLENGIVGEYPEQPENILASWIEGRFAKYGISVDDECVASIIGRCDKSLRSISMEVYKLALYCSAIKINHVTMKEVEEVCPPDLRGEIFDITDAVGTGNAGRALEVMNNLIINKQPCVVIRSRLSRHIRQLICAKELGSQDRVITELKVHPFVAKKLVMQSRMFSVEKLVSLYIKCSEDDRNFKSGKIDERQSLESFIVLASMKG